MEIIDILKDYNLSGIATGLITFLIIGLFHPLVIKAEYHWGTRSGWFFGILGVSGLVFSLATDRFLLSVWAGVFSFSCFWSIAEVFAQKKRVEKGWFPENPKKKRSAKPTENVSRGKKTR